MLWRMGKGGKEYFDEGITARIMFDTSNKLKGDVTEKQAPLGEHMEEGQESSWSVRRKDTQSKDFPKPHLCVEYLQPRQTVCSRSGVERLSLPSHP